MENIKLRNELPADYRVVENLTREAFWNRYVPGCSEHYLLHLMRDTQSFIRELDIVAEVNGKIAGNIVYTRSKIQGDNGEEYDVITFGPLSVLPELQGKGIGRRLIEHTKEIAKSMGSRGILIYGDPGYYRSFGFAPAENFGIGTSDNMYADALLACELYEGALAECKGRFIDDPIFEFDPAAAEEYDQQFISKEKESDLPSQTQFMQMVGRRKPRD